MSGPKRLLIVEDEDTIREVVRRYLEREGHQVREAPGGYTPSISSPRQSRIWVDSSPSLGTRICFEPLKDGTGAR